MFADDTTTGDSESWLDSLSKLVDIGGKAADVDAKLKGQKAVGTPTIIPRAQTGMSTTTWIMIGVASLLTLGTGVYLFTRKA
jgi:LPXTG-motif cell wall-anchored protein